MPTARELMTPGPVTVPVTAKVQKAVEILHTAEVRHLPVVDEEGNLVGMLSDRDLRALSLPVFVGDEHVASLRTALNAPVSTLMNSDVVSVESEADVSEVIELMLDNKIGAVPVVDHDGAVVGIVSYMDVLRELEPPRD